MASALQKLLRKSLSTRIITAPHTSQAPNPLVPLALHRSPFIEVHRECHPPTEDFITSSHSSSSSSSSSNVIFPSFPFGFASKPIFASGFLSPEAEDAGLEDSRTVWADSVKKKRKKKMNKHKYQKLRKRMRRQS